MAVGYHQPGKRERAMLAFDARILAEFEGRADLPVRLEPLSADKARALWNDGAVPRVLAIDIVAFDKVPPFPAVPAKLASLPLEFLAALEEAARTTPRDPVRAALSRVLLRGKSGEVIATDGRQLLVQGGFPLPWRDDVLVPRLAVFSSGDWQDADTVRLGRSSGQVALRVGPWTFALTIDSSSHFPQVETVIPSTRSVTARLQLDAEDAAFLLKSLPKLPGGNDDRAPVTLDLHGPIAVRSRGEASDSVTEIVLTRSTCSGTPTRFCTDRRLLHRALQLGFQEIQIVKPDAPLLCQDQKRTYVWMPLEPKSALGPTPKALRIFSAECAQPQSKKRPLQPINTERSISTMPSPPSNPLPRHGPSSSNASSDSSAQPGIPALIDDAEAVRAMLYDAQGRLGRLIVALKQQRKQSRAVQQALGSLRQLQNLQP
jgi:hypothetical protein